MSKKVAHRTTIVHEDASGQPIPKGKAQAYCTCRWESDVTDYAHVRLFAKWHKEDAAAQMGLGS
ncbi:MAG: hypothetical protein ACYDD0_00930 [Candidatus Dormibacteria bacterium]